MCSTLQQRARLCVFYRAAARGGRKLFWNEWRGCLSIPPLISLVDPRAFSLRLLLIIVTRPKLAYGGQGLAGVSLCASGAQLGRGKWSFFVTDTHLMIYVYIIRRIYIYCHRNHQCHHCHHHCHRHHPHRNHHHHCPNQHQDCTSLLMPLNNVHFLSLPPHRDHYCQQLE